MICLPEKNALPALAIIILLMTSGCAVHHSGYEKPVVTLTSFRTVPGKNLLPEFKIGLHIVNPGRSVIRLKGIAYTVSLEGHDVLTGVSNQLPHIEAYGESNVSLTARINLISSISFLKGLVQSKEAKNLSYSFQAKLDIGTLYPLVYINKKGSVSLTDSGFE